MTGRDLNELGSRAVPRASFASNVALRGVLGLDVIGYEHLTALHAEDQAALGQQFVHGSVEFRGRRLDGDGDAANRTELPHFQYAGAVDFADNLR